MSNSNIEWTDETSNPIRLVKEDGSHGGHWCKKISEGCANCYAEEQNQSNYFGFASHLPYSGKPPENLILDRNILLKWTRIKKPRSIFVCSMTGWCGEWVPMEWRFEMLDAMCKSKANFLLLTKRADILWQTVQAYQERHYKKFAHGHFHVPNNIRIGISAENQKTWNERSPYLNAVASLGWETMISFEPLLGCIDIDDYSSESMYSAGFDSEGTGNGLESGYFYLNDCWGIVGGESGKGAREHHCEWSASLLEQFEFAGIVPFVKQLGSNAFYKGDRLKTKDKKGGDISEFPPKLQIREYPLEMSK